MHEHILVHKRQAYKSITERARPNPRKSFLVTCRCQKKNIIMIRKNTHRHKQQRETLTDRIGKDMCDSVSWEQVFWKDFWCMQTCATHEHCKLCRKLIRLYIAKWTNCDKILKDNCTHKDWSQGDKPSTEQFFLVSHVSTKGFTWWCSNVSPHRFSKV